LRRDERAPMRIAVCISGAQRFSSNALTFFSRCLPADVGIDYFCYMWDGEHASEQELSDAVLEKAEGRAGDVHAKIDREFAPRINFPFSNYPETNIENTMRMFYAIRKCNDLKVAKELQQKFVYDFVIRLRSDVRLSSDLEFTDFLRISDGFIVFPENGHWRGGLNDQFAFSSSRNMDAYSSIYDYIGEHCMQGCMLHPETLVRFHLLKMRKYPILAPINTMILRD
jgi:hypothetical protein